MIEVSSGIPEELVVAGVPARSRGPPRGKLSRPDLVRCLFAADLLVANRVDVMGDLMQNDAAVRLAATHRCSVCIEQTTVGVLAYSNPGMP